MDRLVSTRKDGKWDATGPAKLAGGLWAKFWPALSPLTITIRLSPRLVGKAGYYQPDRELIVLSLPYHKRYGEEEMIATLLHELAHHAVHTVYGRSARPHGPEFLAEMRRVGFPRHCQDTGELKRLTYLCTSCGRIYRRQRKPSAGGVACGPCCKRYAGGRFDRRFKLVQQNGPQA